MTCIELLSLSLFMGSILREAGDRGGIGRAIASNFIHHIDTESRVDTDRQLRDLSLNMPKKDVM